MKKALKIVKIYSHPLEFGDGNQRTIAAMLLRAERRGMDRVLYRPFPHNELENIADQLERDAKELEAL